VSRLLLKDLRPVEMPETVTLLCFHSLLPDLPKVRNSLPAALKPLDGRLIGQLPTCLAPSVEGVGAGSDQASSRDRGPSAALRQGLEHKTLLSVG
jgi:hypothetical protein